MSWQCHCSHSMHRKSPNALNVWIGGLLCTRESWYLLFGKRILSLMHSKNSYSSSLVWIHWTLQQVRLSISSIHNVEVNDNILSVTYNPELHWSQHFFLIISIRVELYFASISEVKRSVNNRWKCEALMGFFPFYELSHNMSKGEKARQTISKRALFIIRTHNSMFTRQQKKCCAARSSDSGDQAESTFKSIRRVSSTVATIEGNLVFN